MADETPLEKLKDAKAKMAEAYEALCSDDLPDNGNLTDIHNAVTYCNSAILHLES